MRDFSFNENDEQKRLEEIILHRKKKIAKQQILFSGILLLLIASLTVYIVRKVMYTTLDGYIHLSDHHVRFANDIFLKEGYVNIGDFVKPGDTLFSYVNIGILQDQDNVNDEPHVITLHRDLELQAEMARQELSVFQSKIKELEKQIAVEEHNIRFGINDNTYKLILERELVETRERLKAQTNKVSILSKKAGDMKRMVDMLHYEGGNHMTIHDIAMWEDENNPFLMYRLATDSAFVTDINIAERSTVLRGEPICTLQLFDLFAVNLFVAAYLLPEDKETIEEGMVADVILNDKLVLKAVLVLSGTVVEEIPEMQRSRFSDRSSALIGVFRFIPGQDIPYWALTNNLHVKLRIRNLSPDRYSIPQDNRWFKIPDHKWHRMLNRKTEQ